MTPDRDLFIQAFWTRCREVIRPELDRAVHRLRTMGHEAEISSQEYDASALDQSDAPPDAWPSLTLATPGSVLSFYGNVICQTVGVDATEAAEHNLPPPELSYDLDQLDEVEVAAIVAAWEASLGAPQAKVSAA